MKVSREAMDWAAKVAEDIDFTKTDQGKSSEQFKRELRLYRDRPDLLRKRLAELEGARD